VKGLEHHPHPPAPELCQTILVQPAHIRAIGDNPATAGAFQPAHQHQ
jgi:hypothetical protein